MAEARTEEEEENTMRDSREQVIRRAAGTSGGRPDRRKPEHRLSQGPLSSIRAAIKRPSTRSTSLSETSRDRDRDRQRDRRRPEITILSAEPLASTSWFPVAPGGFPPPPPPPAAQIWGATIPPAIQPPPSYEEVIREKTQEQVVASSPLPSHPIPTTTIATQTDTGAGPGPPDWTGRPETRAVGRWTRPPRPPLPSLSRSSHFDEVAPDRLPSRPETVSASTSCCDLLGDPCAAADPTDQRDPEVACASVPPERPKPRPRSKPGVRLIRDEVRVQTLVKLREDGLATLAAARSGSAAADRDSCQGKYLQELLEAFGTDDWGFPDRRSDSSQSESEEQEEEEEEDMALRARIQAFERQAADAKCGQSNRDPSTKPEPRPRPSKPGPPAIAPKPKNPPKPSSKVFWEEGAATGNPVAPAEPSSEGLTHPDPSTRHAGGKPPVTPKPQLAQGNPAPLPVPAPRPPLPKQISHSNPKPPPRPSVTPRTSPGAPPQDKTTPTPSPRTSAEVCGAARTGSEDGQTAPDVSPKPAAISSTPPEHSRQDSPEPPGPARPPTPASVPAPVSSNGSVTGNRPEPARPARTPSVKLLPLRPPPIKSHPERPPPPAFGSTSSSTKRVAASPGPDDAPPVALPPSRPSPPPATANHTEAPKKGPPLPPRPKPGHPLYSSSMKQEVLIILDDPSPTPSDPLHQQTLVDPPQCLLDLDGQPEPAVGRDGQSKAAREGRGPSDSQSILPVWPVERKEEPDTQLVSGPRCVAVFDYEGEEDDELTFSQGDVIALLELVDGEWGRGLIHGRAGIFPLSFTEAVEVLPRNEPDPSGPLPADSTAALKTSPDSEFPAGGEEEEEEEEEEEWDTALFDFPGQTVDDLSFQKGALIRVVERVDAQWRRGRLDGREGLYPAAFTRPGHAQPIRGRPAGGGASAKAVFDFTAENEDELTLKVGDIVTQVQSVDEQWISGVVGGKRGIVPKSYVSPDLSTQ